ncbi:GNAT family N-acetyltransferase [Bartonella sp. HY329]|uniref:GNAT family N-acetyltransferase n=1 Tax=unclassified Bartonella TaxID=2645622 RepID=UPI0021C8BD49|nr:MULTISPECIES: GNAT family N-acetyltransferase [unclassified Bartonella]UXM94638.1 GNAT family N-acetyltransferase [Bartonella sp. HY329]UXN08961.1 GNAT family N-acetyltransferase [Bartonella sp. HY328]
MIRLARIEDAGEIIALAKQFHEASRTTLPFSYRMADNLFAKCLDDFNHLCIILVKDDKIVGFLAAQCGYLHFSTDLVAQEIAWFIEPESRGLESLKMLNFYERWAVERGCKYASMVGLGYNPITEKLYQRRGYIAQERHFFKPL